MSEAIEIIAANQNLISMPKYRWSAVRLMDQVRDVLRYHHCGYKREQAYTAWIKRYVKFNRTRHPGEMGKCEIVDQ